MNEVKKFYRSSKDHRIGGLCGGIGQYFSVDPGLVRIATVFVTLVTGILPGLITYVIGWIVIPMTSEGEGPPL
jgi:phage shock protein C